MVRRASVAHGDSLPSIAERTAGLTRREGLIPVYLDPVHNRVLLEIPRDSMSVLYFLSQATGLGSNPIGIDRGADVESAVARFERHGNRELVVFDNLKYRSSDSATDPAHARSVAEAFAPSTVAALPVVAASGARVLVDATDFLLSDLTGVAGTLERSHQGHYTVARDRSRVYARDTRAFPDNTELDASLTFALASGAPGGIMRQVLADPRAFTLRQHISLVALPDSGYTPRVLDPRIGYFSVTFKDYAQPVDRPLEQHWIERHRLQRVNPADPNSPIRNPIIYYIDRGIPEPIRTATKQGVSWWVQAFDDAGLKGAFKVEDLPRGVDPMDARYNVVQWENRNERGWSVGGAFADPRTGEILKGMARLDSHRARTDYNLYAGLMGAAPSPADTAFILARVRQVSAHEVGHTLGLAHNYIASTYGRASVMDYPAPRLRLDAHGNIDLDSAYATGPGAYDVWAIRYGYGTFPPGTTADSLRAIVAEGLRKGYLFLSDADARPAFASDPRTSLWDDAANPMVFLRRQVAVRRVALARFGLGNLRPGEPVATLQERLAPIYYLHRFALNGVTKTIGGMTYANAVRGDGQTETRVIDGATQRAALSALLAELQPGELAIPDTVLTLIGPRPYGYGQAENNSNSPVSELFPSRTAPAFDELSAARSLAQMIVDGILQPQRAGRLVTFATRAPHMLTLGETVDSLVAATWNRTDATPENTALLRVTQRAVADGLLVLAADTTALPEVRAIVEYEIARLQPVAAARSRTGDLATRAHWAAIAADFGKWNTRHELPPLTPAPPAPPGDPFGEP